MNWRMDYMPKKKVSYRKGVVKTVLEGRRL